MQASAITEEHILSKWASGAAVQLVGYHGWMIIAGYFN